MIKSKGFVWLPTIQPSMVTVPKALLSKHIDCDTIHRRCCHGNDATIRNFESLRVKGIPIHCTHESRTFCRSCDVAKSTVAKINRASTRSDDLDTCFHKLAIDIWGPVNTPSIGNFSYVFGAMFYKSAFILAELIKIKSDSTVVFAVFYVRYNSLATKST